ncbi:MAG: ATP-binding cassette domain-containing protein [Clostridia bacterium]|nr:ATP-binding cassette domain-containing protein [Clostridia bacterium]
MSLYVDIEKKMGDFHLKTKFETSDGVLALLGASGCGKSMTLKCIAGIELPDRGKIVLDGVTLFDSKERINLSPQKRKVGYLFQQYALFPNMTVRQNIAAAVRNKDRADTEVAQMIHSMHLEGLEDRLPDQLSGGQKQRTALARILINHPNALLLDEPFSALDSHLRFQMEQEVREVIQRFDKTVLLVSHNRDEVFRLSDDIAIMCNGHIEVQGSRKEVFHSPETVNGAILTGCKNISRLEHIAGKRVRAVDWGMELELELEPKYEMGQESDQDFKAAICYIGIRMHHICAGEGENTYSCQVVEEIENPFSFTLMLRPDGAQQEAVYWEVDKDTWRRIRAKTVKISLPKNALILLGKG